MPNERPVEKGATTCRGKEVDAQEDVGARGVLAAKTRKEKTKREGTEKKEGRRMEGAKQDEVVLAADSEGTTVVTNSTFESLGVCEPLCEACKNASWVTATRIQKEVLPLAFQERDIIGLAETGSG